MGHIHLFEPFQMGHIRIFEPFKMGHIRILNRDHDFEENKVSSKMGHIHLVHAFLTREKSPRQPKARKNGAYLTWARIRLITPVYTFYPRSSRCCKLWPLLVP